MKVLSLEVVTTGKQFLGLSVVVLLLILASVSAAKPRCGDGICNGKETPQTCPQDCPLPVCGNNIIETGEVCDSSNLGGQTCVTQGFDSGTLACAVSCQAFDTSGCSNNPGGGTLEVHYIDVGQGDSEFIITPDGYTMLIDAGEDNQGNGVVSYIQGLGYSQIDAVMASHMHADHLGGLDRVVTALNPSVCYDRGGSYSSTQFNQYNSACSGKRQTLNRGNSIDMGPSVNADILQAGMSSSDENARSIVMKLSYNSLDLLFGGDCTSACEATFAPGDIEVYKVHHHGSSTSTSQVFITAADPEVSIIEVGANNQYGHPTQQTLNRLNAVGSDIYRTDQGGTKVLTSDDGVGYSVGGHGYTAS